MKILVSLSCISILAIYVGCGGSDAGGDDDATDDGGSSGTSGGSSGANGGSSGAGGSSSGGNGHDGGDHDGGDHDGSTEDDAGDGSANNQSDGGGCQTPTLTAPTPGRATIVATLSNASADYTGSTAAFTSFEGASGAYGGAFTNWTGATQTLDRQISIILQNQTLTECASYASSSASSAVTLQYTEGLAIWRCNGLITVDTIEGNETHYHFTSTDCPASSNQATGSIVVTGEGVSLYATPT